MLLLASSVCGLFKWRQFEPEMILLAVGWYLRFSLSYRDVEELLAERVCTPITSRCGDLVQRLSSALADAAVELSSDVAKVRWTRASANAAAAWAAESQASVRKINDRRMKSERTLTRLPPETV